MSVNLKRIYEEAAQEDGMRILVDRLWPRGISKERAQLDKWFKQIGPSNELRKWFNHDPDKFDDFRERYMKELKNGEQAEALKELADIVKNYEGQVTLLFAARNKIQNQANILKEILESLSKL